MNRVVPEAPSVPEAPPRRSKFAVTDEGGDERDNSHWVHTVQADLFFGGWIVLNAFAMAIETDVRTEENDDNLAWLVADSVFNVVFIGELCLRVHAERLRWFVKTWNLFDAAIVMVGVLDSWILPLIGSGSNLRIMTLLRMFRMVKLVRVFRIFRLFQFMKELRLIMRGLEQAVRATVWSFLVLAIIIFICALVLTRVVGKECCDDDDLFSVDALDDYFGTISRASFTLFQFTMEFQPDIARETWDDGILLTIFLILYTVLTNIMLLNMTSSIIVDNIMSISQDEFDQRKEDKLEEKRKQHSRQLQAVFDAIDTDHSGYIDASEFTRLSDGNNHNDVDNDNDVDNPDLKSAMKSVGMSPNQAAELFRILDADGHGTVSKHEFVRGFLRSQGPPQGKHLLHVECRVDSVMRKVSELGDELTAQVMSIRDTLSSWAGECKSVSSAAGVGMVPSAKRLRRQQKDFFNGAPELSAILLESEIHEVSAPGVMELHAKLHEADKDRSPVEEKWMRGRSSTAEADDRLRQVTRQAEEFDEVKELRIKLRALGV